MGKKIILANIILLIIGLPIQAQADFSADATLGCDTLTVQFSDLSTGATSWEWNFGDGTTSSQQTPPPHFYSTPGIFDVTLTINGSVTETKNNYISVIAKPDSSFSYYDTIDIYTYTFTNVLQDFESEFVYNRLWQISDGAGYLTRSIMHTFSDTGDYQVQLDVSSYLLPQCRSSLTKTISVEEPIVIVPTANFSADLLVGCDSLTVQFSDLSTAATSWEWNFGDGTTSSQQTPPPHKYSAPGLYDVTLTINGSIYETKEDYITVLAKPDSTFWYSDTTDLNSLTYVFHSPIQEFENQFDYNRSWLINDGSFYSNREFSHTFADTGLFQVDYEIYADLMPQCSSTSIQKVLVRNQIYVPNVFSPDGSTINDLYIVEYNGTTNLSIYIYSRYGNLVFKSTAPVIVWDGMGLNEQQMNEGVYYYVLTSEDGEISKTGFIHLYR